MLLILLFLIRFLIHSIVVVLVFLCILFFCWLSVLCCLCCHYVLEPYNSFAIITSYLFLFLFIVLTHSLLLLFNSFYCSCGFSMYFTFLSIVATFLFMLPLCLGASLSRCHRCFVLFLFLFSLLAHCVSNSRYCHRCLYDLALVLLDWLLTVWVYNFPYGDFVYVYLCRYGYRKRQCRKL